MSNKPMPQPTETSRPFWEGLRERRVLIQHCRSCKGWSFYPRSNCPHCLSNQLEWEEISGEGSVYSYTLTRVPTLPEFADEMPQKLAVIQLDQGPRLNTTLVYLAEEDVHVGMRVKPVFEDSADGKSTLLKYTGMACEAPAPAPVVEQEQEPADPQQRRQVSCTDLTAMKTLVSEEFSGWSNGFEVSQALIDRFADLSGDDYWIHTDPDKAKRQGPYGGTIAHGALVQVLMSQLQIPLPFEVVGFNNMVNYGSNKLRFPSPVPAGSRIHSRARVKAVETVRSGTQLTLETHIHVVGQERPAVINELVILYM